MEVESSLHIMLLAVPRTAQQWQVDCPCCLQGLIHKLNGGCQQEEEGFSHFNSEISDVLVNDAHLIKLCCLDLGNTVHGFFHPFFQTLMTFLFSRSGLHVLPLQSGLHCMRVLVSLESPHCHLPFLHWQTPSVLAELH